MITRYAKLVNRNFLLLLCAFPLFMPHWISLIAVVVFISGIAFIAASKQFDFQWNLFLALSAIVFPFIIALLWTTNLNAGFNSIQVKLILLVLPFIFAFKALQFSENEQKMSFFIFSLASALVVLYTNLTILLLGFTHPIGFQGADFTYSYRIALEHYSGLHPTYYCAIVYIAAFIRLYQLLFESKQNAWQKYLGIAIILICIAGGLAAASRATFFAFLFIVIIALFTYLKKHPKRWLLAGIMGAGLAILFATPMVQNRLTEVNAKNMEAPKGNNDNGTNVRSGIFACDIQLLKKHWLVGVGTGDIQQALNECLSQYDTHVYKQFNYNTHNEYLNNWLSTGLLGFMIFVSCLVFGLVQAVKSKNWLHLYFLVFMGISFVTENYLDRAMGVTFFTLLQTLFYFKTLKPY